MTHKAFRALHLPKLSPPSVGLSSLAKHIRHFIRDYGLPLFATVVFLVVLVLAAYIRNSQHVSVASLLDSLDSQGLDYGKLLSNEKTSDLSTGADSAPASPSGGTASSFAVNTTSPTSSSTNNGQSSTPKPVFTAAIASFEQGSVTLDCSKPNPKPQWCSKRYAFSSTVQSLNGPGTVNYGWRSTIASATQNGSISVGSGTVNSPLQKTITLACDAPLSFTLQFVILSPGLTQSAVKTINHNCNEL